MNPLYVDIDVSSKSNVAYLMKPDGSKHSNFSVPNSRQLVKRILSAITSESLTDVVIGLEATSVYGDNLVCFLRKDSSLLRRTTRRSTSSIQNRSISLSFLTTACQRMTMWTPLSLLTACVSVKSTKRSILTTTVMPPLKTSQGPGSSLSKILPEKNSVL